MNILIIIICSFFLISCKKEKIKYVTGEVLTKNYDAIEPEERKADLVLKIEPKIPLAIAEHWNRSKWIEEFGQPLYEREINGGKVLEYIQSGPYPPSGRKLITGVIVFLQDDKTVDTEMHVTTFGLAK